MKEWSNKLRLKRWRIGGLCLLVACVAASWWVLTPREPSYQGKTLTEWQDEMIAFRGRIQSPMNIMSTSADSYVAYEYKTHLNQMGTNMMPFLLWQLQDKDSNTEILFKAFMSNWKIGTSANWVVDRNRERATVTFQALPGSIFEETQSFAPELLSIARQREDLRGEIIGILSAMRIDSKDFMDFLVEIVRDKNNEKLLKENAVIVLKMRGKKAAMVAPKLRAIQSDAKAKGDTEHAAFIADILQGIEH